MRGQSLTNRQISAKSADGLVKHQSGLRRVANTSKRWSAAGLSKACAAKWLRCLNGNDECSESVGTHEDLR